MKSVAILGSTGTIGRNTLDVIRRHPAAVPRVGARRRLEPARSSRSRSANSGRSSSRSARRRTRPPSGAPGPARTRASSSVRRARTRSAAHRGSDIVVSAITGINGLRPTLAAVRAGKTRRPGQQGIHGRGRRRSSAGRPAPSGAEIIPVDSEHSGVFQCLAREKRRNVAQGHPDRLGRAVPPDAAPRAPPARPSTKPWPIRAGRWAAR